MNEVDNGSQRSAVNLLQNSAMPGYTWKASCCEQIDSRFFTAVFLFFWGDQTKRT